MRKIPTVFRRDPADMRRVLPEVTPGCEWVLAGEGTATRKYDGTCVMLDADGWWARREVKPGKTPPANYRPVETDPATGKTVGWEPVEQSAFAKYVQEAIDGDSREGFTPGTYELCGPKVNGNSEGLESHQLCKHEHAECVAVTDLTYSGLRDRLRELGMRSVEGVVWHHPDGRMAKLKGRDFPS